MPKLPVIIKRLLKKYGYLPDKQDKTTAAVLKQAVLLCKDWVEKPSNLPTRM
ncbi:type I restriction enzyme endonuclease domain-containing protein [Cylindrospermum stagnale]|uniref:type I restriction enzyme endonuclease domain-containing protein n=1 Tax=Cylindrospermum stagnale TaxID=142864 RepID=UPI0002E0A8F9|nr:type I restriction enzyme endonuclease domain-containing protein [Cylindrospermum stagnale]